MQSKPRVVVVGAGISGLSAAYDLTRSGFVVTVLEGSPTIGGKLAPTTVAGVELDGGAESVLARRPEAVRLIADVGLEDTLTHPATITARIYSRGALRPFPAGHLMGVPSSLAGLARSGVLSPTGTARAARDMVWPATSPSQDVSVADHIGTRMGREVVDRLVEPLLGGVYAGRADQLSLDATLPQIAAGARAHRSLMAAARAALAQRDARPATPETTTPPVFVTIRGGLTRLIAALAERSGATIETAATVRELHRHGDFWRLTVGPASDPRHLTADGVLLACPAAPTARLLEAEIPEASAALREIEYASMAVVTLAYRAAAFPRRPTGSGFLVPAVERRTIKAATFSSVKWPWLAEELRAAHPGEQPLVLRCSIGRVGEEAVLRRDDAELVELARSDLADICGVAEAPMDSQVTRWGGGLPQYTVGHLHRVARVRAALNRHPGIEVCGAAYDGVGIAACVATARAAAGDLASELHTLTSSPP